jgi:hypothetical protein
MPVIEVVIVIAGVVVAFATEPPKPLAEATLTVVTVPEPPPPPPVCTTHESVPAPSVESTLPELPACEGSSPLMRSPAWIFRSVPLASIVVTVGSTSRNHDEASKVLAVARSVSFVSTAMDQTALVRDSVPAPSSAHVCVAMTVVLSSA